MAVLPSRPEDQFLGAGAPDVPALLRDGKPRSHHLNLRGDSVVDGAPLHAGAADESSLRDYALMLRRRKGMLAATIVVGTALTFLVTTQMRPVYRANSSVLFQRPAQAVTFDKSSAEATSNNEEAVFQTQVELFQSRALMDRVVSKLSAAETKGPAISPAELAYTAHGVKVSPIRGTRLIKIQADAHDPQLASAFANAVVAEYVQLARERRWKRAQEDQVWLGEQVKQLRQNLENSQKSLSSFAAASGVNTDQDRAANAQLLRLQDELAKAQVERFAAEAKYEMASKASPDSLSEVVESSTLRDYQSKLTQLRQQLAEAKAMWTSSHYKVKQLQDQTDVLRDAIEKERTEVSAKARNDHLAALRREQLVSKEYLAAVRNVADQANKSVHYTLLKRDLERDRELYDHMMQSMTANVINAGFDSTSIHVIDAAVTPHEPHRPKVALSCGLAMIASTFLGCFLIVLRENLNSTLEKPGESVRYLKVRELGAIPSGRSVVAPDGSFLSRHSPLGIGIGGSWFGRDRSPSVELATLKAPESATAQSFRAALASILFTFDSTDSTPIIVVTSAVAGEGKTTVASNLSTALARIGRRVLLIDAQHRNPRLHHIFELPPDAAGLRELVEASGPVTLSSYVHGTDIPNLCILPAGAEGEEFPDVMQSRRISDLIRLASLHYDFVIVDAPPVLTVADARIWGRMANGVVFVVRAGETTVQTAWSAMSRLAGDGIPVVGTILNDWEPRKSSYDVAG